MQKAFFCWLAILVFFIAGCKNACKDISCLHGGTCKDGTCNCAYGFGGKFCDTACPAGYEGEFCSIVIRDKFMRQWSAVTNSSSGGTVNHALYITAGTAMSNINISNFDNENFSVVGTVSGTYTFDIFTQNATGSYTGSVSGSGKLNGQKLSIDLVNQNGIHYFVTCNP
jgi:hypothetical protein